MLRREECIRGFVKSMRWLVKCVGGDVNGLFVWKVFMSSEKTFINNKFDPMVLQIIKHKTA